MGRIYPRPVVMKTLVTVETKFNFEGMHPFGCLTSARSLGMDKLTENSHSIGITILRCFVLFHDLVFNGLVMLRYREKE